MTLCGVHDFNVICCLCFKLMLICLPSTRLIRYILVRMDNPPKAESILEAALRMNPDCEIAIYNLAVIAHRLTYGICFFFRSLYD